MPDVPRELAVYHSVFEVLERRGGEGECDSEVQGEHGPGALQVRFPICHYAVTDHGTPRHFIESKAKRPSRPSCPFGKDCFYKHLNDDGSTHVFKDGAEASMRVSEFRLLVVFIADRIS